METLTTFKINIKSGEIEISGSESFVEKQIENLQETLALCFSSNDVKDKTEDASNKIDESLSSIDENTKKKELKMTSSFGEWLHLFTDDLTEVDRALIGGYYLQKNSETNDFKTYDLNKILSEHGIKLSNTSLFIASLLPKKLAFISKRDGKLKRFRVSQDGEDYLKTLMR